MEAALHKSKLFLAGIVSEMTMINDEELCRAEMILMIEIYTLEGVGNDSDQWNICRGVEVAFVDSCKEGEVKKATTSKTRLVWLEV